MRRAEGTHVKPIDIIRRTQPDIGSEGLIGNITTQINREDPRTFLNHPGPKSIRREKVRHFVLVTDFVGTGSQASSYLTAAWRNASTKSWKSGKFLDFIVICYSATPQGRQAILAHPSKPKLIEHTACPTLDDYDPFRRYALKGLCQRYGPSNAEAKSIPRLGYGNCGALIAFAHGMPNNAPRLLFKQGRNWGPLFKSRVSTGFVGDDVSDLPIRRARRLERMSERRIAKLAGINDLPRENVETVLVLSALKRRPRSIETVSARTGIEISATKVILARARKAGWINENYQLTENAYQELESLRRKQAPKLPRFKGEDGYYVPQSLRAPKDQFS